MVKSEIQYKGATIHVEDGVDVLIEGDVIVVRAAKLAKAQPVPHTAPQRAKVEDAITRIAREIAEIQAKQTRPTYVPPPHGQHYYYDWNRCVENNDFHRYGAPKR